MPRFYQDDAIEHCRRLYFKFNGQQHDRIEAEMRRAGWPNWSKQNLYTRGQGENQKIGWIEKFGWEAALKLHLATRDEGTQAPADKIFTEIETIRQKIFEELQTKGISQRDLVYQHSAYLRLSIEALNKVGAGNTLEAFVSAWERLLDWLAVISPTALAELLKVDNLILEKAAAEYGVEERKVSSRKD
jgi:hypothetical protein